MAVKNSPAQRLFLGAEKTLAAPDGAGHGAGTRGRCSHGSGGLPSHQAASTVLTESCLFVGTSGGTGQE